MGSEVGPPSPAGGSRLSRLCAPNVQDTYLPGTPTVHAEPPRAGLLRINVITETFPTNYLDFLIRGILELSPA